MATYDWEQIKAEYIAGGVSYRDLSAKYGVSYDLVTKKGREGEWNKAKQRVAKKATSKLVEITAGRQARSLSNIMTAADKLSSRLIDDMDAIANARDVSDIAKALKYAADTLAQVYGIQSPAQLHRQKMDEERLKLERERLEMDRKRQETDSHADPVRIMIVQPGEEAGDA